MTDAPNDMPAEIHILGGWRGRVSSGPMQIVAPDFAGTQRYVRADLATTPDVTQAASLCELRALLYEVEAVLIGPSDEYEDCAEVLAKVRAALAEGRG